MKKLNKKTIIISIIIIFTIGIYYLFIKEDDYLESSSIVSELSTNEENEETENKILNTGDKEKIVIYIAGAVKTKGYMS